MFDAVCGYHDGHSFPSGLGNHAQSSSSLHSYNDTYCSSSKLGQCLNPSSTPRLVMSILTSLHEWQQIKSITTVNFPPAV